jgi:hypothetical protein
MDFFLFLGVNKKNNSRTMWAITIKYDQVQANTVRNLDTSHSALLHNCTADDTINQQNFELSENQCVHPEGPSMRFCGEGGPRFGRRSSQVGGGGGIAWMLFERSAILPPNGEMDP